MVNASVDNGNEIDNYIDMRVVGSCEAAWRLLDYPIQHQFPAVIDLRLHLEDQQTIVFEEGCERRHVTTNNHAPSSRFFLYRF